MATRTMPEPTPAKYTPSERGELRLRQELESMRKARLHELAQHRQALEEIRRGWLESVRRGKPEPERHAEQFAKCSSSGDSRSDRSRTWHPTPLRWPLPEPQRAYWPEPMTSGYQPPEPPASQYMSFEGGCAKEDAVAPDVQGVHLGLVGWQSGVQPFHNDQQAGKDFWLELVWSAHVAKKGVYKLKSAASGVRLELSFLAMAGDPDDETPEYTWLDIQLGSGLIVPGQFQDVQRTEWDLLHAAAVTNGFETGQFADWFALHDIVPGGAYHFVVPEDDTTVGYTIVLAAHSYADVNGFVTMHVPVFGLPSNHEDMDFSIHLETPL